MRARVLDRAPLRKTHGTELGLASVAHTVRLLGGALDIDSDGASGTHVTVDLPCIEWSQTPAD
jgi:signal transduction histidine kinase